MLQGAWLFIGFAALLMTLGTLAIAAVSTPQGAGDALTMVGGTVGFLLWAMWAVGALSVTTYSGGSEFTNSHPELAVLGVALAMVPGYLALTGPIDLIGRYRNAGTNDL
jgi:hypothetical protein